jgi:3-isopropylmalate dehydrogenase
MTSTSDTLQHTLLVLPGDGIGLEIMPQVRRVAAWFRERRAVNIQITEALWGIASWKQHGDLMPQHTWQAIQTADAILFGATGSPEYDNLPVAVRRPDQLLRIRRELDLYNNLRPVNARDMLLGASTLRPEIIRGTDMVIVRELSGGIYFSEPQGIETLANGEQRGFNTSAYTTSAVERIARSAFTVARTRRNQVCSVDKSNVIISGVFWRDIVTRVHREEFGDVQLSHMYADNCAMQLVRAPRQFDVILTDNLFGDLLSDCAAMVTGSIGMLPSASLGPLRADGRRSALYEPIHGSAPDIAGRGSANPLGAILSFGMCLQHTLALPEEEQRLVAAVDHVLGAGIRTADIAEAGQPSVSTSAMGDAVLRELELSLRP